MPRVGYVHVIETNYQFDISHSAPSFSRSPTSLLPSSNKSPCSVGAVVDLETNRSGMAHYRYCSVKTCLVPTRLFVILDVGEMSSSSATRLDPGSPRALRATLGLSFLPPLLALYRLNATQSVWGMRTISNIIAALEYNDRLCEIYLQRVRSSVAPY